MFLDSLKDKVPQGLLKKVPQDLLKKVPGVLTKQVSLKGIKLPKKAKPDKAGAEPEAAPLETGPPPEPVAEGT
ncbi:MAG: hypothetical protein V3S82_00480, partial [Dehalococcoidia bacterium]